MKKSENKHDSLTNFLDGNRQIDDNPIMLHMTYDKTRTKGKAQGQTANNGHSFTLTHKGLNAMTTNNETKRQRTNRYNYAERFHLYTSFVVVDCIGSQPQSA